MAGLADSHIRDSGQVEWLVSITSKCGSVFSHSNWGKIYELLSFSEEIDLKLYDPKSFSATRLTNYVIHIYDSFRHDYPIVESLKSEKLKALDLNASKSDKEKSRSASEFR